MNKTSVVTSVRTEKTFELNDTIISFDDGGCSLRINDGDTLEQVAHKLMVLAVHLEVRWMNKTQDTPICCCSLDSENPSPYHAGYCPFFVESHE